MQIDACNSPCCFITRTCKCNGSRLYTARTIPCMVLLIEHCILAFPHGAFPPMSRVETKESPKLKTINTWLDEIGDKSEMGIACKGRDFV